MENCLACDMPLHDPELVGAQTDDGPACVYCTSEDGKLLSCEEVFEGGVEFFLEAIPDIDEELAERLVRRNMKSLAYWQTHPDECLEGPSSSDDEFAEAMSMLEEE
jgi:hypothetical protein